VISRIIVSLCSGSCSPRSTAVRPLHHALYACEDEGVVVLPHVGNCSPKGTVSHQHHLEDVRLHMCYIQVMFVLKR
jgi:hypothetical protein